MSEIRKSNHTETADKKEVDALKSEVRDLKSRMARMAKDMEKLTSILKTASALQQEQQKEPKPLNSKPQPEYVQESATSKKRRVSPMPSPIGSAPDAIPSLQLEVMANARHSDLLDKDLAQVPTIPAPSALNTIREESNNTLTSIDQEIVTTLLPLPYDQDHGVDEVGDEEPFFLTSMNYEEDIDNSVVSDIQMPDISLSFGPADIQKPLESETSLTLVSDIQDADPQLVEKMKDSLSKLPKNLQELFVERLVRLITHPEAFQTQVDAVTALASAAVKEAQSRMETETSVETNNKDGSSEEEAVLGKSADLATAVLGSFLSRYGATPVPSSDKKAPATVQ